jgi:hypothetical protein
MVLIESYYPGAESCLNVSNPVHTRRPLRLSMSGDDSSAALRQHSLRWCSWRAAFLKQLQLVASQQRRFGTGRTTIHVIIEGSNSDADACLHGARPRVGAAAALQASRLLMLLDYSWKPFAPIQQASLQPQPGSFTDQTCRAACARNQLPLYALYCGTTCACSASIPPLSAQATGCRAAATGATCGNAIELQYIHGGTARL